jgi:hypothetical protein
MPRPPGARYDSNFKNAELEEGAALGSFVQRQAGR